MRPVSFNLITATDAHLSCRLICSVRTTLNGAPQHLGQGWDLPYTTHMYCGMSFGRFSLYNNLLENKPF
jgi:hypothetical protein